METTQQMDWVEIAKVYGPLGLLVLAGGWFFIKQIWPDIRKRLDNAESDRKENQRLMREQADLFAASLKEQREADERRSMEQGRMFMEALRNQNLLAAETHEKTMQAHNELVKSQNEMARTQIRMAEKLEVLDEHIRNGKGEK